MDFAIMGAGGLGCLYGGVLARTGNTVHFIARGKQLEALRSGGLHMESSHVGDFHLPTVSATDDPATIGPVDVVLMCVKAYDLEAACEAIRPLLGPNTYVLPVLNGADIAERIGVLIGPERVLGGTSFASCNVLSPGHARHVLNAPLLFGELAGGGSERVNALEAALQQANAAAKQSADVRLDIWQKYIIVSPLAGVCSASRLATKRMAALPETRALYEAAGREVHAVGRAEGVALPDDAVPKALAFIDSVGPQHTVSTLLDLRAGRRLELDAMVGAVVRLGARHGVPTPVSATLLGVLKPFENGPPAE